MPKVSHRFRYSEQHLSDKLQMSSGASNTRRTSHTRDKHPSNSHLKQMSKRTLFQDLRQCKAPYDFLIESPASAGHFKAKYRPGYIQLTITGEAADQMVDALMSGSLCSTLSH
jgi:hypothetical protein